jgi:hypothetical protein
MEKLIPFLTESMNGHDTEQVPESQVPAKVEEQIGKGNWPTIEKKDGTTEVVTEKKENWGDTFKDVKSVTSTSKMKGG